MEQSRLHVILACLIGNEWSLAFVHFETFTSLTEISSFEHSNTPYFRPGTDLNRRSACSRCERREPGVIRKQKSRSRIPAVTRSSVGGSQVLKVNDPFRPKIA